MPSFIAYPTIEEADGRSREWWLAVLGRAKRPEDITEFVYSRRQRTGDPEADEGLPDGVDNAIVIHERDENLDALIIEDELEPREAGECAELYPLWQVGDTFGANELRSWIDELWKIRQPHTAHDPGWEPQLVPALWLRYRKDAHLTLPWVAGEWVDLGIKRTFDGATYTVKQAHVTEFAPPDAPALWDLDTPEGDPWQPGTYPIDAIVTHNDITWQSRRNNNSWEPGMSDSGWLQIAPLPGDWYYLGGEGYPLDWEVMHNGQLWRNTSAGNHWEPGVFGWVLV
jgi:hypothetical protein